MPSCFLFVLASIINLRTITLEYYNCKFYTHLGFRTLNLRIMGRASFLWATMAVTFGTVIVETLVLQLNSWKVYLSIFVASLIFHQRIGNLTITTVTSKECASAGNRTRVICVKQAIDYFPREQFIEMGSATHIFGV